MFPLPIVLPWVCAIFLGCMITNTIFSVGVPLSLHRVDLLPVRASCAGKGTTVATLKAKLPRAMTWFDPFFLPRCLFSLLFFLCSFLL